MDNVYKFVQWDVPELDTLKDSTAYKLMEKLNNGEKLTRDEKDSIVGASNWYNGRLKLMGYCFNFLQHTRRFLVHTQYYGWREINAFDKTGARQQSRFCGKIYEILDLNKIREVLWLWKTKIY